MSEEEETMKLVALMYLEEDEATVAEVLKRHEVTAYSRLPLEGHGAGVGGWYGDVAPYESRMTFALLPAAPAEELMNAVAECQECHDPRHPIRAMLVDVERAVNSGSAILK
jgi:hypothetical protein